MSDLELLRRFEPIVRYTAGEMFFPCAVDEFVAGSGLYEVDERGNVTQLVAPGELDIEKLAEYDEVPTGGVLYMSYAKEPLDPIEYQRWRRSADHVSFHAPGRLARVPLLSRIGDSLFDLSLLVRGSVPGGMGAAADIKYNELLERDDRRVYYGRVVRDGGWIVLHYLFFFTMNNWRSGFYGVNDHESDWEQVFVYLDDDGSEDPQPVWAAFASHDFSGDDLRRRWDDPLMVKEGNHPVIYAGVGSHASYFEQGEYVMGATPKILMPLRKGVTALNAFWVEQLGQGDSAAAGERAGNMVSIPFVDYARGEGRSIGPGQDEEWTPILISDEVGWVDKYRGLWGLDTRDPFGGERAPAGAKYNRDGSVRQSWYDPLGWAGLDKVYPPTVTEEELQQRIATLEQDAQNIRTEIEELRVSARDKNLDVIALRATEYFSSLHEEKEQILLEQQARMQELQAELVENEETQDALRAFADRVAQGDWGPPTAHLKHVHQPAPPVPEQRRAVEIWAAISGALALFIFVGLLVFRPDNWFFWAVVVGIGFGAIESLTRRELSKFMLTLVVVLAVIAILILFFEFWRWVIMVGLIAVVVYMIRDNLREVLAD